MMYSSMGRARVGLEIRTDCREFEVHPSILKCRDRGGYIRLELDIATDRGLGAIGRESYGIRSTDCILD